MTVGIRIELGDEASDGLRALAGRADLTDALDEIGGSLETSTQRRFETETDPEGRDWKRLSDATLARRGPGAKKLRDQVDLYDSIGHRVLGKRVAVGANRTYARIQHLGGKAGRGKKVTIPARPYLGISAADRREIAEIVRDHLEAT